MPLCDGSKGLTLRVFSSGGGQQALASQVRVENGYPSFAMDGQCQYFISGGWSGTRGGRDEGWRQGSVDRDLLRTLERLAGLEDLAQLACDDAALAFDQGVLIVSNARSARSCGGPSGDVQAVYDAIAARASALWEEGQRLDGDLHVAVSLAGYAPADAAPPYAWPDGLVLADYFEADPTVLDRSGQSRRIAAEAAAPLRALRERYLLDSSAAPVSDGMRVTDGELNARIYMRDALPYEDEEGLWPLPGE